MTPQPHDLLFKWTFSNVPVAAAHLQHALPLGITTAIDWTSLGLVSGSFVAPELRNRHADLLYAAKIFHAGPPSDDVFLHLLFEHQSAPDALMAHRCLGYAHHAQSTWVRANPRATRLPAVLPIVLYHGARPWRARLDYGELLDLGEAAPHMGELQPRFRYLLQDLSKVTDADLRGAAMGILAQRLFKHAWDGDLWLRLMDWGPLVVRVARDHGLDALRATFRYISSVSDVRPNDEVHRWIATNLGNEAKEELMSWAQQLVEEGRQVGRQEGRQEGQQALAMAVLRRRFGELPAAVERRLHDAGPEELEALLCATSLQALLDS